MTTATSSVHISHFRTVIYLHCFVLLAETHQVSLRYTIQKQTANHRVTSFNFVNQWESLTMFNCNV